jgi:gliding motility-associated-like protein
MVNPLPNANITTSAKSGCVPLCLDYNSSSSSNIVSYSWFVNNAGISSNANGNYCFSTAANYSLNLMVTDNNGCSNYSNPINISVSPAPIADFNHAPIKPIINIDGEVTFTDASHGATITNWNWYFMNTAQYTSNLQNPTFLYSEPGVYVVALVVKSDKGCTDTILRELVVGEDYGLYVPNAFTPNADGLNDVFQPKGFGVVKYQLQIFDRWGERVFETKTFDKGWDGRFRGKGLEYEQTCEEGTYTWLINVTNVSGKAHELKGHVTLIK